jgi:predicted ATPase
MARLDRLSAVKEVAQLASAIGRNFEHDLLAAVTHLDQKTLTEALDKLIGAELVFRRGTPPNARYEFKHALVQDVAYQSLLNSTRHEHHRRIAMAMETQFPQIAKSQPELLARHYTEAALPEQAIPYWLNAARQAAERFASLEAIVHCERAFDILPKVPESAARDQQELDLLLVFALAHMSAKGFGNPEILHIYNRAQELAENLADDSALFTVTWGQWINHQQRAQVEQARGFVEAVSTIAGRTNDSELILQAHHASWTTNLILGDHAAVSLGVSEGLKIYDSTRHRSHAFRFGGHDPGVCAHLHGALTSWAQGYPDQAAQYIAQGISLAEEISHPLSFVIAFAMASLIGQHRGEASKVLISAQRTIDVCSEIGVPHYTGVGHILHGWATVSSGDIDSGIAEMVQGLEIFSATGAALRLPYFLCLLAEAYCMAGKHDNSIEAIEDAHKAVKQVGEEWWHADVQRVWGDISLAQSPENPGDAESRYLKSLDIARAQGAKSLELRGATSLAHLRAIQGRKKEAREVLAPVFDWFSEGFETADLKKAAHLLEELA